MTKRELIERASRAAERRFNEIGGIDAVWLVITPKGETLLAPPPVKDKDLAAAMVRTILKAWDATAFVFIDEAWMRVVKAKPDSPEGRAALAYTAAHGVRNHPDRVEVVMFHAEDAIGSLSGWREIVRKVNSRPRLGPLKLDEGILASEGRFVGMLPQRGTAH